jgi:predicted XRE-type DNA-binding protein
MNSNIHNNKKINSNINNQSSNSITETNLERENRLSTIITLHSTGLTQSEIAEKLHVNQSTISRDLQSIKDEARYNIEKFTKEEIPFEYLRYISGMDKITTTLWSLIENENSDPNIKSKIQGLSLLKECYEQRISMLVGGLESKMNAKNHIQSIQSNEKAAIITGSMGRYY